jgi:hypothetical protein
MAGTRSRARRSPGRAALAACLAAALLAPFPPAHAEDAESPAEPRRVPYEAAGPSERRGRTYDVDEMRTETGEPSFGAPTSDLDQHEGEARPLRDLSRPPGPKPQDPAKAAPEVPAPLRLRRRPGELPGADDPLVARLCEAEREHAHAEREFREAVRAYKRARRDEYPRGDAKYLVVQRRALAEKRLARAAEARGLLLGEAAEQALDFDPAECPAPAERAEALGGDLQVREDRQELPVQPDLDRRELEPEEARDREGSE